MKKVENILLRAGGYTVLILFLFFLFALIGEFTEAYISFGNFTIIFLFGIIISISELILEIKNLRKIYKHIIHYFVLLTAFTVIFVFRGNLISGGSSVIFSSVIIFTLLYAVIFTISYLCLRVIRATDKMIDNKAPKTKSQNHYQSLYSGSNQNGNH